MKSSAPEQKAAAIEAVLKQFPNWSEESKQRLRNLDDADWVNNCSATTTFTYPPAQIAIQLQITDPTTEVFKGQTPSPLNPALTGSGGAGTLYYDDFDQLVTSGTQFHIYPNSDDGPAAMYLVILFCDTNYLYGLFTYQNIQSIDGDAIRGTGAWS